MTVKGVAFGEDYVLGFFGGTGTGKTETAGDFRSNQVKRFGNIKSFDFRWKVATNWLLTVTGY